MLLKTSNQTVSRNMHNMQVIPTSHTANKLDIVNAICDVLAPDKCFERPCLADVFANNAKEGPPV